MVRRYFSKILLVSSFISSGIMGILNGQDTIPFIPASSGNGVVNELSGSVQISVGQVFIQNEKSADYNLNQGIQQPSVYELVSKVEE